MTATTTSRALAAKEHGQEQSMAGLLVDDVDMFLAVIEAVRPGVEFTVNDVRDKLDAAAIPVKARGGLFAKAAKAGLIRPAVLEVDGQTYPKTVPSTGHTANAARVRVYVRTGSSP